MKKISIFIVVLLSIAVFQHATAHVLFDYSSENTNASGNLDPDPAGNPYPMDGSVNIDLNITLSWTSTSPDPGDDVTFNVFFGTNTDPENVEMVYPSTSYYPGLLEYNTQYYWRIDSYGLMGATTGTLWTFTTKDDTPPIKPYNPSPENESVDIPTNTSLNWNGSDPDGDNVSYDVYFGTSTNPPNMQLKQNNTSYNPGTLEYNTQYHWRIDAWDDYGYSTTGDTWTFTTKDDTPPFLPSNPSPLNNSMNNSIRSILTWTGGDPDEDNVSYDVYFGTSTNPPNMQLKQNNTSYNPGTLEYNTQYHWRIDAWDDYGYSTTGELWTFTTIDNSPPFIPSNPYPENASTNIYIDSILSWEGGDPDGDNVSYDVYFGTDTDPLLVSHNQNITSYQPDIMNTTTEYYWRIIAYDDQGHNSSGPLWNFKTSIYTNNPPDKPEKPQGPTSGKTGVSYSFSSSTTDSNGEPVFYMFDWDDGSTNEWVGPYDSGQTITVSHVWDEQGSYAIKVKAKDIYGGESFWSDPLQISLPKSREHHRFWFLSFILDILSERHLSIPPFLSYLSMNLN